jgi:hypothetical protein
MFWIRVSLNVAPRRVEMHPKLVCVHMLCTQVWWGMLLDPMLKAQMCLATRMHMRR